ncbi:signal peptidase I [Lachnospiraceae bacterium RM5]|nr:signal peptidase I [Lachnospiraceae bacterium RM5]
MSSSSKRDKEKNKKRKLYIPTEEEIASERKRLKTRKEYIRIFLTTIYALIVVASVAALIATMIMPVLQVSGSSMEPTLNDDDIIVLVKTSKFKTGEMCGFYWQNKLLLKRVIGGPGDIISIDGEGNVTVNGEVIDEPYIKEKSLGICDIEFPYQVPENRYFVLGDNRDVSIDSRSSEIGSIEKEQIIGKVFFRIYPFKKMKFLK